MIDTAKKIGNWCIELLLFMYCASRGGNECDWGLSQNENPDFSCRDASLVAWYIPKNDTSCSATEKCRRWRESDTHSTFLGWKKWHICNPLPSALEGSVRVAWFGIILCDFTRICNKEDSHKNHKSQGSQNSNSYVKFSDKVEFSDDGIF